MPTIVSRGSGRPSFRPPGQPVSHPLCEDPPMQNDRVSQSASPNRSRSRRPRLCHLRPSPPSVTPVNRHRCTNPTDPALDGWRAARRNLRGRPSAPPPPPTSAESWWQAAMGSLLLAATLAWILRTL
jgi:hypothetical protein